MKRLGLLVILASALLFAWNATAQTTTAEKMAALSDQGLRVETAVKRYNYVLPRLVSACSDLPSVERVGDVLYVGHRYVKDAGASGKENLLAYTNSVFLIVKKTKPERKCIPLFGQYTIFRRNGETPEASRKAVGAMIVARML